MFNLNDGLVLSNNFDGDQMLSQKSIIKNVHFDLFFMTEETDPFEFWIL